MEKLGLPFTQLAPHCDETPLDGESPQQLVVRLAELKARSCNVREESLVIGSDQVCVIDGEIIGKPHTREKAIEQLTRQSGKAIHFYTGLAVYDTANDKIESNYERFTVYFRELCANQIEAYVDKEQPFYCAGSFKSEGLGIALFEKLEGRDPNTLVGLPLIMLLEMLARHRVDPLS